MKQTLNNRAAMHEVKQQIARLSEGEKQQFNEAFLGLQTILDSYGTYGYLALGFMALKMALELDGETIELEATAKE